MYLVRHGETDYNLAGRWQGSLDIPLNETGRHQASQLESIIKDLDIDKIYSSPKQRALETAEILNKNRQVEIEIIKDLEEIHLGEWEGQTLQDIQKKYPDDFKDFDSRNDFDRYGVEPYESVQARAWKTLQDIAKNHESGEKILVTTHGAWLMSLLCKIYDVDLVNRLDYKVENTELLEVAVDVDTATFSVVT